MNAVFADSFYFLAVLNKTDLHHRKAVELSKNFRGGVITTEWVLAELADAFAASHLRQTAADFIRRLPTLPGFHIVPSETALFHRGLDLFASRPDKEWSLTDCISFCVMKDAGIREALTGDRHFAQAGFVPLFA